MCKLKQSHNPYKMIKQICRYLRESTRVVHILFVQHCYMGCLRGQSLNWYNSVSFNKETLQKSGHYQPLTQNASFICSYFSYIHLIRTFCLFHRPKVTVVLCSSHPDSGTISSLTSDQVSLWSFSSSVASWFNQVSINKNQSCDNKTTD